MLVNDIGNTLNFILLMGKILPSEIQIKKFVCYSYPKYCDFYFILKHISFMLGGMETHAYEIMRNSYQIVVCVSCEDACRACSLCENHN